MRLFLVLALLLLGGCIDEGSVPATSGPPASDAPESQPPQPEPISIDDRYRPTDPPGAAPESRTVRHQFNGSALFAASPAATFGCECLFDVPLKEGALHLVLEADGVRAEGFRWQAHGEEGLGGNPLHADLEGPFPPGTLEVRVAPFGFPATALSEFTVTVTVQYGKPSLALGGPSA
ncbi:MAG: hypothetical protein QOD77_390 [Thermoplasmata archaeon]|jgi:hypothetical protein|nr:hypothetical protein [Thermoplasmata archaeon]